MPTLSPRPRLPASIGASILQAEQLAGAESRPLRTYYLETVPRQYVEQRLLHLLAGRAVELPSHGRTRCGRVRIRSPLAELAEVGA